MSVIKQPVLYVGSKSELNLYTLFDSGSNYSCIHPDYARKLADAQPIGRIRQIATASDSHFIEVSEVVRLEFYIDDIMLSDEFLVVPGLSEEVLIGALTFQKWRIKLNFDRDCAEVDPKLAKLQLKLGKLQLL